MADFTDADADREVFAHRVRIQKNPFLTIETLTNIHDEEILISRPLAVEVTPTPLHRHADDIGFHQPGEALLQRFTPRDLLQNRIRVGVLGVYPLARLRAFLIFKPAIGIDNLHSVYNISDLDCLRLRWRLHLNCIW